MGGYIVAVKHQGHWFDIQVNDVEIMAKKADFAKNCPQLINEVSDLDIAEMVANYKIPLAYELSHAKNVYGSNSVDGACEFCGAKFKTIYSVFNKLSLSSILFNATTPNSLPIIKSTVCEDCFEHKYSACNKCEIDFPNNDLTDGVCSLCSTGNSYQIKRRDL